MGRGIHCGVKTFVHTVMMIIAVLIPYGVSAQSPAVEAGSSPQAEVVAEEVPDETIASAVAAVSDLGNSVVQGRYQVALERMNPDWKSMYAKRAGGMKALEDALGQVAAEMVRQGITMISCKPQGKARGFGVAPGPPAQKAGNKTAAGSANGRLVYTKWMVLVPTLTKFRILQKRGPGEPPGWIYIDSTGYQVAVSDRSRNDWTFIDGAGLSVSDLRSLFATLPIDMELPPVEKHETR
jgi:hypothetical protein